MPELLNICCVFDKAPFSRKNVFDKISEAAATWVRPPHSFTFFKENGEAIKEGLFVNPEFSIEQPLSSNQFLNVYSEIDSDNYRSIISITESNGHAIYNLSFPINSIIKNSLTDIEKQLLQIFKSLETEGQCALLIGSEIEEPSPQPRLKAIARVFEVNTGVNWIVAKSIDVETCPATFKIASTEENVTILRQRNFNLHSND